MAGTRWLSNKPTSFNRGALIGAIIGKNLVRSQYDRLNRRDIQAFLSGIGEEASFTYPGTLSVSGEIRGKNAIDDWFHKYMEHFPKISITPKSIFVADIFALGSTNTFAVEWDERLRTKTGRSLRFSGVTVIDVKRGKATRISEYLFDTDRLKAAWGES